jgi:hypothetical protein
MPRKVFTAGEVLAAADVNEFLQDQAVMTFAGTAARGSAIGTAIEGMFTYLEDTDTYESYTGSGWVSALPMGAWTAFTPTWSALTVGNGIYNKSHYYLSGKTATVAIDFELGSTSAVTGNITLTLPTELSRSSVYNTGLTQLTLVDASVTTYLGIGTVRSVNARDWLIRGASGTPVAFVSTSATSPFTWTTGDRIVFGATFEVA